MLSSLYARLQTDLKRLIALRRVAHLNLSLAAFSLNLNLGQSTLLLMSLTHGIFSSTLFFMAGIRRKNNRLIFWLFQRILLI
jgi:formate hydrogenlyase subunit 3/multisubunit Na+/H+ antiporter MnhD subunit